MPLHLIRSIVESESEYYYDCRTDVWVFADRDGYAELIADLQRARSAKEPIHVAAIPPDSPGMRCAIMPASGYSTPKAVLRVVERVVFWHDAPAMQVVLCGNKRGYARLAAFVQNAMLTTGGPLDHWHLDDERDHWVSKRSISLNLRGAGLDWNEEERTAYGEDLRTGGRHRLPDCVKWIEQDAEHSYDCFPPDFCDWMTSPGWPR